MHAILEEISRIGIVPVIAVEDAAKAVPLAKALVAGGLPVAEITFRTAAAEAAMRAITEQVPEMLVGAGTVLTRQQADAALSAGAKFLVSPGFHPDMVHYVQEKGGLMIPGTATPGEMEQAMAMGLEVVKFFPAEQNGGLPMLKALAGPYRNLRWMPTGGINGENLTSYLAFDQVAACGGTWMVKKELIEGEQWDEITRLTHEAVKKMLGLHIKGVYAGAKKENAEMELLSMLQLLLGNAQRDHGERPCIEVGANSVERAEYYLHRCGVCFLEESRCCTGGKTREISIAGDFHGVTLRLTEQ